jgi:WD40 repeat protein
MITPTSAAFDRTGTLLAMTFLARWQESDGRDRIGFSGVLIVWDIASAKEIFRRVRSDELNAVAFDPNGRVVAAGGTASGGAVFGWDIATGKEELTLTGHTRPILALAFGPNGRLATGGRDRTVKVWDVANRREMLTLDGFAREVTHLAFTSDGRDLVAATGIDLMGAMMAPGIPTEFPRAEVRVFHGSKITAPPGQR